MRSMCVFVVVCLFALPLCAQTAFHFTPYATNGSASISSALADFNRDGFPDMAVLNIPFSGSGGTVDIFINDHKGGFGTPTNYAVPSSGTILAVDVNGDGWPDLVISGGQSNVNTILLNNRDGTFRMGTPPVTKATATSFLAGDFNNDGKVDLAAVESGQIEILLNQGAGTFTAGQVLTGSGAAVADFDGDGNLDIANVSGTNAVVWWGKGNGTFTATTKIPAPTSDGFSSFAAADFNNDGLPDLAISSNHFNGCVNPENPCGTTTAHIYRNLGGRKFSLVSSYVIGNNLGGVLYAADLNGDLNYDLVNLISAGGVSSGDISFRPGNGNNTFGAEQVIDTDSSSELDFRDLNLDSRTDIVIPVFFPAPGEVIVGLEANGFTNCQGAGSASLNAKICAPANNASVSSSLLVTAAGNSPIGVKRLEVWVDGKKVYQKLGDQMNKRITLSPGRHRLVVVAVDKYVGFSSTVEFVNVQ